MFGTEMGKIIGLGLLAIVLIASVAFLAATLYL